MGERPFKESTSKMLTKEEFTCLARKYMDMVFRISCVFHGRNMHPWKIIWKLLQMPIKSGIRKRCGDICGGGFG